MKRTTYLDFEGKRYVAELARVRNTHLGYEDHGIFAIGMNFEALSGAWGQGDGLRAAGNGFAANYIEAVLPIFGASTWEEIGGSEVYVLRADEYGPILGIASKSEPIAVIFASIGGD